MWYLHVASISAPYMRNIWQGKIWWIWRIVSYSPKLSLPILTDTVKCICHMWPNLRKGVLYMHSIFQLQDYVTQLLFCLQLWNLVAGLHLYVGLKISAQCSLIHKVMPLQSQKIGCVYKTPFCKFGHIYTDCSLFPKFFLTNSFYLYGFQNFPPPNISRVQYKQIKHLI